MSNNEPRAESPDPKADALAQFFALSLKEPDEYSREDWAIVGELEQVLTDSPTLMPYPTDGVELDPES